MHFAQKDAFHSGFPSEKMPDHPLVVAYLISPSSFVSLCESDYYYFSGPLTKSKELSRKKLS